MVDSTNKWSILRFLHTVLRLKIQIQLNLILQKGFINKLYVACETFRCQGKSIFSYAFD